MTIIADSGSTKTDWYLVKDGKLEQQLSTIGLNPYYMETTAIKERIQIAFDLINKESIEFIYFYGAGCADELHCNQVENALRPIFKKAKISVNSDLLAAARAACGKTAGIVGILGTGSNSCAFDGDAIVDQVTCLGFLLGDEGSGAYLGKQLVQAYYYRELPTDLEQAFVKEYKIVNHRSILNHIYQLERPNTYLASFVPFIKKYEANPFINTLLENAFGIFIKKQLMKYPNYKDLNIHFVGSIAYHFRLVLKNILEKHGMKLGTIIQKPIACLVAYHS